MKKNIPINEAVIRLWAKKNKERARNLGIRFIQNQNAEKIRAMESLGKFEDEAQEWAIAHPIKAKILIMRLLKQFK